MEAQVKRLADLPPRVDAKTLRRQLRLTWSRIENVPIESWMRWWLVCNVSDFDAVTVEQMESWAERLPRLPDWNFRGFLSLGDGCIKFRKCMPDQFLPRVSDQRDDVDLFTVAFHSQPIRSVYSDIPKREDVYLFLKLNLAAFFAVGKSQVGIFIRDHKTSAVRNRLLEWEAKHPYHISRLVTRRLKSRGSSRESPGELFQRYTHTALRGIGLHWPDKLFARRAGWPQFLLEVGLNVQVVDTQATKSNSS